MDRHENLLLINYSSVQGEQRRVKKHTLGPKQEQQTSRQAHGPTKVVHRIYPEANQCTE